MPSYQNNPTLHETSINNDVVKEVKVEIENDKIEIQDLIPENIRKLNNIHMIVILSLIGGILILSVFTMIFFITSGWQFYPYKAIMITPFYMNPIDNTMTGYPCMLNPIQTYQLQNLSISERENIYQCPNITSIVYCPKDYSCINSAKICSTIQCTVDNEVICSSLNINCDLNSQCYTHDVKFMNNQLYQLWKIDPYNLEFCYFYILNISLFLILMIIIIITYYVSNKYNLVYLRTRKFYFMTIATISFLIFYLLAIYLYGIIVWWFTVPYSIYSKFVTEEFTCVILEMSEGVFSSLTNSLITHILCTVFLLVGGGVSIIAPLMFCFPYFLQKNMSEIYI